MTRSDIRGVMVGVECSRCNGKGSQYYPHPNQRCGGPPQGRTGPCQFCSGTGIASKCISLREFELMLDRDLLAEPGGTG